MKNDLILNLQFLTGLSFNSDWLLWSLSSLCGANTDHLCTFDRAHLLDAKDGAYALCRQGMWHRRAMWTRQAQPGPEVYARLVQWLGMHWMLSRWPMQLLHNCKYWVSYKNESNLDAKAKLTYAADCLWLAKCQWFIHVHIGLFLRLPTFTGDLCFAKQASKMSSSFAISL